MTDDARSRVKAALLAGASGVVAPLVGLYKLELLATREEERDKVFQGYSQAVSMVPGRAGEFLRRAFYAATLTGCHPESCVEWGTVFSKRDVTISRGVYIGARCMIGRCFLAEGVTLASNVDLLSGKNQHGTDDPDRSVQDQPGRYDLVRIGKNTWVGNGAILMADVGERCVVAAGSVVVDAVPDDAVVGGNPARIIRRRDPTTRRWVKPS